MTGDRWTISDVESYEFGTQVRDLTRLERLRERIAVWVAPWLRR